MWLNRACYPDAKVKKGQGNEKGNSSWNYGCAGADMITIVGVAAVVCGCGREGGQGETSVPGVPAKAQPAEERQSAAPAYDLDAVTNISAMTDMEYASLDGGPAPLRMYEPREPSGEAAKWFECADDPTWFTNSVGERISVERYCAIANVEDGQEAECSFDGRYQRCGVDMTLRLAEFYVGKKCKVSDSGNGDVMDGSDERIVYRAWKVRDDLYLLFEVNNAGTMRMLDYIIVKVDNLNIRAKLHSFVSNIATINNLCINFKIF